MIVGQRIKTRLKVVRLSAAELARRVGMSQSGMVNLMAGRSRSTTFLHKIARELLTTPAYLTGEVDDPDVDAPPLQPAMPQAVMMHVLLPSERALHRMFAVLLAGMPTTADQDEIALLLAQRLSIGLSQLQDVLPDQYPPADRPLARSTADEVDSTPVREPIR